MHRYVHKPAPAVGNGLTGSRQMCMTLGECQPDNGRALWKRKKPVDDGPPKEFRKP